MNQPSWEQLKTIFDEARRRPASERAAYLDEACVDDTALRQEIDALLGAFDDADDFLADPDTEDVEPESDETPDNAQLDDARHIGRYRLLERLGEGGFGTVFRAEQVEPIRRFVALKLIRAGVDSQRIVARFEAERQALAMMEHPNIARVIDGGTTNTNSPFFVMELINGVPITNYSDNHRLSVDRRLRLFIDVCGAVQHAHQKGIIHRDLKPSNVLVSEDNGITTPKVIDFGVAKALQTQISDSTLTTRQQIIGTPAYMSPEQAAGAPQGVDTRTDVYSLGVLLYELLTGATPFESNTLMNGGVGEMIRIIQQVEPVRPSTRISQLSDAHSSAAASSPEPERSGDGSSNWNANNIAAVRGVDASTLSRRLSGDLDWIVMKCLEKDADRRYPTAAALAEDISRHLRDEPIAARPPSRVYRIRKFARRNRGVVAVSSLLALALVTGTVVSTLAFLRADRARIRAQDAEKSAKSVTNYLSTMLGAVSPDELGRDATLRDLLDNQDAKLTKKFADQPLIEATLRLTIGNTYSALGRFKQGETYLRRAVALRKANLGPDDAGTMEAEQRLAANLRAQSRYGEAEPLLRHAVAIQERTLGAAAPETLTSKYELAVLLRVMGKIDEAESVSRDLLDSCRRELGRSNKLTLESQQNLAAVYAALGRGDEARSLMEDTIRRQTQTLGADHPDTLLSRFDLAIRYCGDGQHAKALALYPDLLAAHERTLGDNHRMTLAVRSYYARELEHTGHLAEAEKMIDETLATQRSLLGAHHRDVLESLGIAADIDASLGKRSDELKLRRTLLDDYETARGAENPLTLVAMSNLGATLFANGDIQESEALQRRALAGMRKRFGPADARTLNTTLHLVNLLQATHQYDEEAKLLDQALHDFRAKRPEMDAGVQELIHRQAHMLDASGHKKQALAEYRSTYEAQLHTIKDPVTINHYAGCYATALLGDQRYKDAADVYAESIARQRSQPGGETLDLAGLLDRQAYCLIEAGSLKVAETSARQAAAIRNRLAPKDEKGLAGSRMLVAMSLSQQHRFAEAEPLLRKVLEMRKHVFGPDHWLVNNTESVLGECLLEQHHVDEARDLLEASYKALAADPNAPPPRVKEASDRLNRLAAILKKER